MRGKHILLAAVFCVVFSGLASAASIPRATTCHVNGETCEITITIKLAFIGADATYRANAENAIESEWNGASGSRTYGDCKCKVKFDVITSELKQGNCTPQPLDEHCIIVTPFATKPPVSTNGTKYMGYMKGVSSGPPIEGWWSDQMDRPVQGSATGETYRDFAHEAGHMMGLDDCDGDLMCATHGNSGHASQANVNAAVENVCGQSPCPDRCCCGNGKIEGGRGEKCDPVANPNGCGSGQSCCPYCCSCYGKQCDPQYGEYATEDDCRKSCKDPKVCAYSYWAGCWSCLESWEKELYPEFDPSRVREAGKCNHSAQVQPAGGAQGAKNIAQGLAGPGSAVGSYFENERANIYITDIYPGCGYAEENYAIIEGGQVVESGEGALPGPTVNIYADAAAVDMLMEGEIGMPSALKGGLVSYEGVGFFEGLKYWLAGFYVDNLLPAEPLPEQILERHRQAASLAAEAETELVELEPGEYVYVVYPEGEPSEPVLIAPEYMQGEGIPGGPVDQ